MAGASVELSDALLINPNDTDQIEQAICRALKMPLEEQRERLQRIASHPFGSNRKQMGCGFHERMAADRREKTNDYKRKRSPHKTRTKSKHYMTKRKSA